MNTSPRIPHLTGGLLGPLPACGLWCLCFPQTTVLAAPLWWEVCEVPCLFGTKDICQLKEGTSSPKNGKVGGPLVFSNRKPPIRSIKFWKWIVGSHHPLEESKSLQTPNILSIRANKLLLHMPDDTSVTGTASTLPFHALTSYLQALHGQNKQFWVWLTT